MVWLFQSCWTNGYTAHMPGLLEQCLLATNSQGQDQYQKLEPPLPIAFRVVRRDLAGLSIRLQEGSFELGLWGFKAVAAPLLM